MGLTSREDLTLDNFARVFPQRAMEALRIVSAEAHVAAHEDLRSALEALSPGSIRGAWEDWPTDPRTAAERLEPTVLGNTRPHAKVISGGRRQSTNQFKVRGKHGTFMVPAGKWLGSTRAPLGIKWPALRQIKSRESQILETAVSRAEARLRAAGIAE
jgi:hypothetical protein